MICLHRLNRKEIVINSELIEYIEETPDTIITLSNGKKIIVTEPKEIVIKKVIEYKRNILNQNIISEG